MLYMLRDILKTIAVSAPVGILFSFIILFTIGLKDSSFKKNLYSMAQKAKSRSYRYKFYYMIYMYIIFSRTVVCRESNYEPLSDVLGGWKIFQHKYTGLDYQVIGNVIMFIPLTVFLAAILNSRKLSFKKIMMICLSSSFLYSLFIELCQLATKRGTFQLSDLVWNTLGGFIGFLIYSAINKMYKHKKIS